MTFNLNAAVQQAWDEHLAGRAPTGPSITVSMHLDGPRKISITVPDDFATWTADQQCAVVDRAKRELLSSSVDMHTRYSQDEHWEQPGRSCMPCTPPPTPPPPERPRDVQPRNRSRTPRPRRTRPPLLRHMPRQPRQRR